MVRSCTVIFFIAINNEMSFSYKLLKSIRLMVVKIAYSKSS